MVTQAAVPNVLSPVDCFSILFNFKALKILF